MANSREGVQSNFKQLEITDVRETGEVLGRGSYGEVREADWRGTRCATKRQYRGRVMTWSRLRHPNIVQLLGVVFDESSTLPVLVLEIMPTSLRIHLETCSKMEFLMEQKIKVLHQVAVGLAYLHGQYLVHLNLSTKKILLHPAHGTAKITDFGVACAIGSDRERRTGNIIDLGAYAFMPPEVFDVPPRYNDKADVFSFGCVILSTLSHAWPQPLAAKARKDGRLIALTELERRQQYFDEIEVKERTHFRSLVELCLEEEADARPSGLSIVKDLADIQAYYRSTSLEERIHGREATVSSLKEHNAAQPMMNQTTPETGEVEEVEFATIYSSREQLLPGHDQERPTNMMEQPEANSANAERKVEQGVAAAQYSSHSREQLHTQDRTGQLENSKEQATSKSKVKERAMAEFSHRKGAPTKTKKCKKLNDGDEGRNDRSESEGRGKKKEKDAECASGGSVRVKQWSWSGHLQESVRSKKSATSLSRERGKPCAASDTWSASKAKGCSATAKSTPGVKPKDQPTAGQEWKTPTVRPGVFDQLESLPSVQEGEIRFCKRGERYYEFSPSYPARITIGRKTYASCEQYLLAQKYTGRGCRESVWLTPMWQALDAKFTQHEDLRQLLLSTELRNIVYHKRSDDYWGDGGDGSGENQLGKMLMQLRKLFRKGASDNCETPM